MLTLLPLAAAVAEAPDHGRLIHLIRHDCGSCHGLTLEGGLGPPLTPQALQSKSDEQLVSVILTGRPEQAMPPWRGILSPQEARWIVRQLRRGL